MLAPKNSIEIIEMVKMAYNDFPLTKINRILVTLMSIYNSIIEHYGDDFFKISHMTKDKMEHKGTLVPRELILLAEVWQIVDNFHNGNNGNANVFLTNLEVEWDVEDFRDLFRNDTVGHGDQDDSSVASNGGNSCFTRAYF
jgi:hypothetical protein